MENESVRYVQILESDFFLTKLFFIQKELRVSAVFCG